MVGNKVQFLDDNNRSTNGVILDKYIGITTVMNETYSSGGIGIIKIKTHINIEYYIIENSNSCIYHIPCNKITLSK